MTTSHPWSATAVATLVGTPTPTAEQRAVIEAPLEPALVVAGAGSGKTATMTSRVLWLVANRLIRPDQVLGLTFTKKAAGELAERIRRQLATLVAALAERQPELRDDPFFAGAPAVLTYHAYAAQLYGEHALRDGREPSVRLLGEAVAWQYAAQVVGSYCGPMAEITWQPSTVIERVRDLAGDLAEHLREPAEVRRVSAERRATIAAIPAVAKARTVDGLYKETRDFLATLGRREELLPIIAAYHQLKRRRDVLDYGDQVALAAALAANHQAIGRLERDRHSVVLLDEYQDTGHAQRQLLTALFGGGHPVTAVGDPFQSIYGWRGASEANLSNFRTDFPRQDGAASPVLTLTTSFRNGGRILAVANALADPLRAVAGHPVAPLRAVKERERDGEVVWALHETVSDEATWVADQIAALVGVGVGVGGEGAAGAPATGTPGAARFSPGDVAILVRVRSQMDRIQEALVARGVPVEVVGIGGLLATPEVRDVVCTLRVLSDPSAGSAAMRLLTGPRWRIGPRDLAALGRRARRLVFVETTDEPGTEPGIEVDTVPVETESRSLIEALDNPGPPTGYSAVGYQRILALREELRALRRRADQSLPDLISDVIATTGLDVELVSQRGVLSGASARRHLDRFLAVAEEFANELAIDRARDNVTGGREDSVALTAFLAYLSAAELEERGLETDPPEASLDAVSLLTMHGAKGLEWPVVVLPGLTQEVFPNKGIGSPTWVRNAALLPFELRGDRSALPDLRLDGCADQDAVRTELAAHTEACKGRGLLEERRLLYVAATRPRSMLLCSGSWWGDQVKPRGPSAFLSDIKAAGELHGVGTEACWVAEPAADAVNPMFGSPQPFGWPYDPLGERRGALAEAAARVEDAAGRLQLADGGSARGARWAREAALLLSERAVSRAPVSVDVALPGRLSVSDLVALRRDPVELARRIRRPVPFRPAPLARRGTAFHTWVENRFGAHPLVDIDELPGSADDGAAVDDDLSALKTAFLFSEWGARVPIEVEVAFESRVGGVLLRGRMDAVFFEDGHYDVVDWKTGSAPRGSEATAAAVQLAAYRLAWADLSRVPVSQVRAAFHYVRSNTTVRPADLLDAAGLAALVEELPVLD